MLECKASPMSARDEWLLDDDVSFLVGSLRDCTRNKDLTTGRILHHLILKKGLLPPCSDALVIMYAHAGALEKAKELLDTYKIKNVSSWAALITANLRAGRSQCAFTLYEDMKQECILPDPVTYASMLKVCCISGAEDMGIRIHEDIANQGLLQTNIVLGNILLDMYAKCGALAKALRLLMELPSRDVFSWSTIIAGYAQYGQGDRALLCFDRMLCEDIPPNAATFICVLKACGMMSNIEKGKQVHSMMVKSGFPNGNIVLGSALIDMYMKCGSLPKAHQLFKELPSQNVISWNILIAGYVQHGLAEQALKCFEQMQHEGIVPDSVTYASILSTCGAIGASDIGGKIHYEIMERGLLEKDIVLGNALVDMYAKCGAFSKAQRVLNSLSFQDVVSWNTLITAYAQQGQGERALECFERMQREGASPNAITFRCVLSVYSHLGLVKEGHKAFVTMQERYGLKPDMEAYNCMIDLFGRAGDLENTVRLLREMPLSENSPTWHAPLRSFRKRVEVSIGCLPID